MLWHHDSGQVALWAMDGAHITNNQSVATPGTAGTSRGCSMPTETARATCCCATTAARSSFGRWTGRRSSPISRSPTLGLDWNIAGTGDFDGDGKDDILWRNDSGQVVIWEMDGAKIVSNQSVETPSNVWQVQDVGDYNGDSRSDVLWRHDSGQVVMWEMNGAEILSNHEVTPQVGNRVVYSQSSVRLAVRIRR